jgi:phosphoglycerate kinase
VLNGVKIVNLIDIKLMNLKEIKNSNVLVRVCYDLSTLEQPARITDSMPTIFTLLENGNKVVLLSHWGRPKGTDDINLSLKNQVSTIEKELLKYAEENNLNLSDLKVDFVNQYETEDLKKAVSDSTSQIVLLENTRFDKNEKSKDSTERKAIAEKYSVLGEYFVDDGFPVSHRKEATNYELAQILPSYYGVSFQAEIDTLTKVKENPEKPFVLIMGGAKLETKLPLIEKLLPRADKVIVGGLLSFTFAKAANELGLQNVEIYASPVEEDFLESAKEILKNNPDKIVIPEDYIFDDSRGEKEGVDAGPNTLTKFKEALEGAKTVFWNGPIGFYEKEPYNQGTLELANYIANLDDCYKVAGGGDITTALPKEIIEKFSFASMGGGATLEFLSK